MKQLDYFSTTFLHSLHAHNMYTTNYARFIIYIMATTEHYSTFTPNGWLLQSRSIESI